MTLTSLFIVIFHNLYQGFCCCVQIEERVTCFFFFCVRQGCVVSPMLYFLVINFVGRHSINRLHFGIPRWQPPPCRSRFCRWYCRFRPTQTEISLRENQAASAGLRINGQRTKIIRISYTNLRFPITVSGQQVEEVANSTYLSSIVSLDEDAKHLPRSDNFVLELTFPLPADQTVAPGHNRCADHNLRVQNLENDGSHRSKVVCFPSPMSETCPQDHLQGPCFKCGSIPSLQCHRTLFLFRWTHLTPSWPLSYSRQWYSGSLHKANENKDDRKSPGEGLLWTTCE